MKTLNTVAAARSFLYLIATAYYVRDAMAAAPHTTYSETQVISKSFHAAGRTPGTATFAIAPDTDPARYGVSLLGYANWHKTAGFPTAQGTVSSPNSLGCASYYGWVQIIASSNTTLSADNTDWAMDPLPAFVTKDIPFTWYGSEPTLFDGPFNIEAEDLDWSARSFLAYLPDPAHSKTVVPLIGFEWGYRLAKGKPSIKELKGLDLHV